jgi:hypothetical protein
MIKAILYRIASLLNRIISSLESMLDASRSDKLLIAAFLVAVFRQMGVNGHFIGFDPATQWAWFQPVEVFTGIGMALLEGLALAYVSKRWRKLSPVDWREWTYWGILLTGQVIMLLFVVFYVAMYAFAAQRGGVVSGVFDPGLNMFWNITVAGANPLIAVLIGIVEDDEVDRRTANGSLISELDECWLSFMELYREGKTASILPSELANYSKTSEGVATQVILEAKRLGMM